MNTGETTRSPFLRHLIRTYLEWCTLIAAPTSSSAIWRSQPRETRPFGGTCPCARRQFFRTLDSHPARGRRRSDYAISNRTERSHRPRFRIRWSDLLQRTEHREDPDHRERYTPCEPVHHVARHRLVGGTGSPRPRPRSRLSFDSLRVRLPDLHEHDERHDLQSHPPDRREWEHVSLILRVLEAAPAQCRDEPQRRRDRVRSGQDAVRGRR